MLYTCIDQEIYFEEIFYHEDKALNDYLDRKEIQAFDGAGYLEDMPNKNTLFAYGKFGQIAESLLGFSNGKSAAPI